MSVQDPGIGPLFENRLQARYRAVAGGRPEGPVAYPGRPPGPPPAGAPPATIARSNAASTAWRAQASSSPKTSPQVRSSVSGGSTPEALLVVRKAANPFPDDASQASS